MTRTAILRGLALLVLAGLGACQASDPVRPAGGDMTAQARPNIVLIVADDLGWGDLSSYGGPVSTPNIDALASDGVRFTQAYASAYQCSPSRAGLLTGRYQQRFGHESNFRGPGDGVGGIGLAAGMLAYEDGTLPPSGLGLPTSQPMLAERMKAAGYRTAMVGKWHLGFDPGMRPTERGFGYFFGFLAGSSPYALASTPDVIAAAHIGLGGKGGKTGKGADADDEEGLGNALPDRRPLYYSVRDGIEPVADQSAYMTDLLSDKAVDYIKAQSVDKPFFLYLAHLAPHQPLTVTRRYYDRLPQIKDERKRIYYAMILALDDSVGAIRAALKERGLDRDTLIIFTSDNGCPRPRIFCSNGNLREGKQTLYEGGLRIPLIAAWPGRIAPGRTDDRFASLLDLTPTFLKLAGAPAKGAGLDGTSLLPRLFGAAAPDRTLFWRHQVHQAVRSGRWKMIVYRTVEGRTATFLFDLETDPAETTNVAASYPEIVTRLNAALHRWDRGLQAPRWVPPNPKRRTFDGVTVDMY